MKKIFTLFVALFAVVALNAQYVANFEDGTLQGWTSLDADADGYGWVLGSQIGGIYLVDGASLTGYNESQDMVCSGSYSNVVGVLTPDNYLISPKLALTSGATMTFMVTAQDASYSAEHYAVMVSTTGTNAADFTIVFEETFGAKAQATWQQKTVNLGSYAGQQVYVAIRHFNCSDMFILDVDDITITNATVVGNSIEENNSEVSVYPIPANNVVNVNAISNISNVEVYTISGQKVGDFTANGTTTSINTESLSAGMYLMKINTENGVINKKFSVAR